MAERSKLLRFIEDVALLHSGNDCLAWPFGRTVKGRGQFKIDGEKILAHRYVCKRAHGEPPTPQHEAAHSCGKGHEGCVSPNHLSWKTSTENQADKLIHGTHNRGARNGRAKITEDQAKEIISLRGKELLRETGARFGISPRTVSDIQARRIWTCLEDVGMPNHGETFP